MREHTIQAQPYPGEHHEKAWGHELWIANNARLIKNIPEKFEPLGLKRVKRKT